MPRTTDNDVTMSSSRSRPMRCSRTVPSTTFAARSLIAATLLHESPAVRSLLAETARTASGERSPVDGGRRGSGKLLIEDALGEGGKVPGVGSRKAEGRIAVYQLRHDP